MTIISHHLVIRVFTQPLLAEDYQQLVGSLTAICGNQQFMVNNLVFIIHQLFDG